MKKKNIFILIVVMITAFAATSILSACNSKIELPDEEMIRGNLEENIYAVLSSEYKVSDLEIIEVTEDPDTQTVSFDITLLADDGEAEQKCFARITYRFNDEEKGWDFYGVSAQNRSDWTITPISGVSENQLRTDLVNALSWERITINDEIWYISDDNISNISVDNRNTALAQSKETLTVSIEISDEVLVASGQLQIDYEFSEGRGWRLSEWKNSIPFASSVRPDIDFELSNDEVLAEVLSMRLPFETGSSWSRETQQIIDVSESEIDDFTHNDTIFTNKGTIREYLYSFNLDKGMVKFDVTVKILYSYEKISGWNRDDFNVDLSVSSVDLEGTVWTGEHTLVPSSGTNPEPKPMTLEITDIASNGAAFATLTFDFGDSTTIIQKFEGTFDMESLTLDLRFKEWVTTPIANNYRRTGYISTYSFQRNFEGFLSVEDMTMKSTRRNTSWSHDFDLIYNPDGVPSADGDD